MRPIRLLILVVLLFISLFLAKQQNVLLHIREFIGTKSTDVTHHDSFRIRSYNPNPAVRYQLHSIRKKVENYLKKNDQIPPEVAANLSELRISRGMNKDQVRLIFDQPQETIPLKGPVVIWHYDGKKLTETHGTKEDIKFIKLKFDNTDLVDIQVSYSPSK